MSSRRAASTGLLFLIACELTLFALVVAGCQHAGSLPSSAPHRLERPAWSTPNSCSFHLVAWVDFKPHCFG